MKHLFSILLFLPFVVNAQITAINTSFEDYTLGSVKNQNKWTVTNGSGNIVANTDYAHTGSNGLQFLNKSATQVDFEPYSKSTTGLNGDVYVDFWIKIKSLGSTFTIMGYDLGSPTNRTLAIEFGADNKIKVYDGSSGSATVKPANYTANTWYRLSFKLSNSTKKYWFALNGNSYSTALGFREVQVEPVDFHSLRFSHPASTTVNCDVAIDDLYIGNNPIAGIDFAEATPNETFTVTVNQPNNAKITLSPEPVNGKYEKGTKVTASVDITDICNFRFTKWTGDLTSTTTPATFTVSKDMTVSAQIDENPASGITRPVQTTAQLSTALAAMNPGDIIELADGTYNISSLSVTRGGCESRPVIIRAKNQGMAKLTGKVAWSLKQVGYVTIEGFVIESSYVATIFKMEGCNNVRITKNILRMSKDSDGQTSKWITVGDLWDNTICTSHHNRIDHNYFDTKLDGGAWVILDGAHGTSPGDISKYDRIDHNYFRNNTPRADNEKETIRLGVSDLTPCSAYCTVEYNFFEECDGDPEIVSVKSCDNIIRYNTFRRCLGTLSLRQGFRNTVEGNYFFGEGKTVDGNGCGGIRVYAKDHKIINNYFEGLTGEKWDAACTITNGDNANTSTSWSAHFIPENVIFAFNTFVNNKSNVEIGFTNNDNYGKYPKNCIIANNIFAEDTNPILKSYSSNALAGVTFSNNIMYPTGTASLGINLTENQAKQINPQLVKSGCKAPGNNCNEKLPYAVYKLIAGSPAINAATGNYDYVTLDFEGQPREGVKTIGADTYSNEKIAVGAVDQRYVGPDAIDFELIIAQNTSIITALLPMVDIAVLDQTAVIQFSAESVSDVRINIYDITGLQVKLLNPDATSGLNQVTVPLSDLKGIYIIEIQTNEYKATKKIKI